MIIYRRHRMVFLHIPKTGGSSVAQAFKGIGAERYGNNHMNLKAAQADDGPGPDWLGHTFMARAFVWTVVRNPYARIVSRYIDAQGHHPERFAPGEKYEGVDDFESFLEVTFENNYLRPQAMWVERELDYIGRTRSLQQDVNFVTWKCKLPKVSVPQRRRSDHGPWFSYYDDRCADLVEEYYGEDFKRFGFPMLGNEYEDRYGP